jgi:hypothetical protein
MEHYVTIFDSLFLPQGLALHSSLERHSSSFTLWVLCTDDEAFEVLGRLGLPHLRRIHLNDVETPSLLSVKPERTRREYCWTLTPFAPRFVFEADSTIDRVTYVDADVAFLRDPSMIHGELEASGKHVLITEHAYATENDLTETSGRFCVQFVTFTRAGESVRRWWEERCVEWCYARAEDGKFGDQKYLDHWPELFGPFVHVLPRLEWCLGPWNATRFSHEDAVFYHFHGLRLLDASNVDLGDYALPRHLIRAVYDPYLKSLKAATAKLAEVQFATQSQHSKPGLVHRIKFAMRAIRRHGFRSGLQRSRSL